MGGQWYSLLRKALRRRSAVAATKVRCDGASPTLADLASRSSKSATKSTSIRVCVPACVPELKAKEPTALKWKPTDSAPAT